MTITKFVNRIHYINHLITRRCTGSPKEFAQKLGMSERAWYKLRDELINDLDLPIEYCKYSKSYQYSKKGNFEIGFKPLSDLQKENTIGGGVKEAYHWAIKIYRWFKHYREPQWLDWNKLGC